MARDSYGPLAGRWVSHPSVAQKHHIGKLHGRGIKISSTTGKYTIQTHKQSPAKDLEREVGAI